MSGPSIDTRGIREEPALKNAKHVGSQLEIDLAEACGLAIAQLRKRGHSIHSIELFAWVDTKVLSGYMHVIDPPKAEGR